MNAIFIAKAFRQTNTVTPEAAGQLGAFVGGYVGPIFSLIGVFLLFMTLKSQSKASELDHFENRYFELLKMHRDNVSDLQIQGAHGRKLFVLLLRELRCALDIVRQTAKKANLVLESEKAMYVAYYCLFFGVGPNSSRMLKMSLPAFDEEFIGKVEEALNNKETKKSVQKERNFPYVPFEGHQSRLGHYYRHLYQMIRYVDEHTIAIDKYEYVKTIRAQLSTHEQAMLLVNSRTLIGQDWWSKGFLVKYRLVQNIPKAFFDDATEIDTSKLFEAGYFEWEEAPTRRV